MGERAAAYVAGADGVPSRHMATVEEAVERRAGADRAGGDVVLLKGSRSMRLERIGAVIAPEG